MTFSEKKELTAQTKYRLNTGYEIPVIGLGVFEADPTTCTKDVIYQALNIGYRHFDTAQSYGNEEEVAQGILKWLDEDPHHHRREDVFYTTKVRTDLLGYETSLKALEESWEKVKGLGYIDLALVHSPLAAPHKRLGTYEALQDFVDKKIIRSIGVSNFGIKHIKQLLESPKLKYKPAVNQIELHPWLVRQELVDYLSKENIVIEAFSPLTRGIKFNDIDLLAVAEELGKSPAQVLIRWALQRGLVPLPKSSNEERLNQNIDVFDFVINEKNYNRLTKRDENFLTAPKNGDMIFFEP